MPAISNLNDLVVLLVRPRNPLNIGAAARAMSNFGAPTLRLVNPYAVAFRDAVSAVGAHDLLKSAAEFATVAEAVADCALVVGTTAVRNRALQHPLRQLDQGTGKIIRKQLQTGRVAILFGSENIGLTNEDFSHCHWLLRIRTEAKQISMNLAQAVAVCLYELAGSAASKAEMKPQSKLRSKSRKEGIAPATAGDNEQITTALLEALHKSGYVKPGTDIVTEKKVRSLILRLELDGMDAKVLLGMLRQILWKVRRES